MQPNNIYSQKILEVFEQLHLTDEQIDQMEDYLAGEAEEEVLKNLKFQDLYLIPHQPSASLFMELVNKEQREKAKRLFNILFAVGGSTCAHLLPAENMTVLNNEKNLQIETAKIVAVTAQTREKNPSRIYGSALKSLGETAKENPENVRRAIEYYTEQNGDGKLLLYTLYFLLKYPDIKPAEQSCEEKGGFGGITKLFQKKESSADILQEEDGVLMKEYEECLLGRVNDMLNKGLLSDEVRRIGEELYQEELSEEAKRLVKRHNTDLQLVKMLAGCAFVNFSLSKFLKNFVSLCLSINRGAALNGMEAMDARNDLRVRGGNFDVVFGIDTKSYIEWAAVKSHRNILRVQFSQHRKLFLSCCDKAECETANVMMSVIKEQDMDLFQERQKQGQSTQKEKVARAMIEESSVAVLVRQYLMQEIEIDQLLTREKELSGGYYYYGGKVRRILDDYYRSYQDEVFYNRCQVYMILRGAGYFFTQKLASKEEIVQDETKKIFAALDSEKLDLAHQMKGFVLMSDTVYSEKWKAVFVDTAKTIFRRYLLERREEMTAAFRGAEAFGRYFALLILGEHPQEYKDEILGFAQDSAKMVKEELTAILYRQPDWEAEVKKLLVSKKAAERELAVRVLLHWDGAKYEQELTQALEKEKNAKVRIFMEKALQAGESGENGRKNLSQEELVKELHMGGKKRSLAWAYEKPFSAVHKKNGEEASEEYLQAILLCYFLMETCGVNQKAAYLAEELDKAQLAVYVNELFDKWMEAGAEAKKRWVLYAEAIHGGADIVKKLHHQIQEWPKHARGAIASEAVQALALNPEPQALLIVDGIARKFKFKQVKAAAGKALEFAAAQLGLTREELADKIVPDLGFNEKMERIFDYGERKFTVTITTALEIEVFDESGKKLKNLPAPGKKDDAEKAAAAYEEFKQMKKQMKTTVSSQKTRLELALSAEREWSVSAWKELFVKNPIMHQFAIGLIWGIYEERALVQSFRYMEDGSFNTEEEEEYELPESGKIGLVHPIELSEESRKAWREQLEDYEIIQPIEQLSRGIFYLTEEEKTARSLERFGGCILNDLSFGGKLQTLGWYRGSVQDAGGYYTYYREDTELGLGVELHFSGSFVGAGDMGDITVYDARFYKAGTIPRGSYMYDEVELEKGIPLTEIPERYFSEIVRQLAVVTASSKERDEEWKKNL